MKSQEFISLLEEAKANVGNEYPLKNKMSLYFDQNRWSLESKEMIFGFDNYKLEGEGISLFVNGSYLGLIDPQQMKRVV